MELGSRDAFARMGTLGIEEEFYVVDEAGRPTAGIDDLIYGSEPPEPLADRLDHELFQFTIETQTPLIERPEDARAELARIRQALADHATDHGYRVAAAGLHPSAKWRELDHATKPRYRAQLDRIQYPQHRNTTAGLHVHVGVDDADKATWIANRLRWYLPPILALSANSPFWNGFDTGLASARAKIFENLPNTGIPTAFEDFDAYRRFERRMLLDENKWRAIRYGHDAEFVTRSGEDTASLGTVVDRECDRLGVDGIRDLYADPSGATTQRRIHDEDGHAALRESLLLTP